MAFLLGISGVFLVTVMFCESLRDFLLSSLLPLVDVEVTFSFLFPCFSMGMADKGLASPLKGMTTLPVSSGKWTEASEEEKKLIQEM